jgi:ferric-dicitrate binding protein FerR (iron transport regulator)
MSSYLTGELTPREEAAFYRWLVADTDRITAFDEYRKIWERAGSPRGVWNTRAAFERFRAAREASVVPLRAPVPRPARALARLARGVSWPRRAAAALMLAGGLSTATWYLGARGAEPVVAVAPIMKTVATRPGQRATLQLSDGTRVTLGVASTLRYPADLAGATRTVELDGEAYFEVQYDAHRPFVVRTARAVARDLGTRFVVRAYADLPHTDVVVTEGLVALTAARPAPHRADGARAVDQPPKSPEPPASIHTVSRDTDLLLLGRGDLGRLDARDRLSRVSGVDTSAALAWARGELVFTDTPVREVTAELRRWYGADIRVGDDVVGARPLTASFDNEPLDVVLKALTNATGTRVVRHGAEITIAQAPSTD